MAIVDTSRERLEDAVWRETDGMGVQCIVDAQYWMPVATDRALGFAQGGHAQGESAVVVAAYAASPETSGSAAAAWPNSRSDARPRSRACASNSDHRACLLRIESLNCADALGAMVIHFQDASGPAASRASSRICPQ